MPVSVAEAGVSAEKSGVLRLRLPVSLHHELADLAQKERVSLNYMIGAILAAGAAEWTRRAIARTQIEEGIVSSSN
jgi:HicB-like protein involved in pilus formation